jgi:hypothetical protein
VLLLVTPRPVSRAEPPADKKTPPPAEAKFSPEELAFYEKEVRPVLEANCLKCHGTGEKVRGGLRLDSRAAVLKGGDNGPVVALDKPETSLLLKAIHYKDTDSVAGMPPKGKMADKDIATLTRWVKAGVPFPPGGGAVVVAPHPEAGKVTPEARNYWAYLPLHQPAVPVVKNTGWVRNPIDAFILAKLEANGIEPAAAADRVALLRRVTYDLTGLPPSPEEVDAFVNDTRPNAYEKVIDGLLASPHYGEKWGRHWLDLVRYAETHGYERDSPKPQAWRYRDYVIASFNKDKPYDVFLREQLAGDELDRVTTETMVATGYYRLGIWDDEPADRALARYDVLDGVVSTTGQVVLGMSIGCARCHDHKRDPIAQKDYYRLLGCFRDITDMTPANTRKIATAADRDDHARRLKEKQARESEVTQRVYQAEQRFTVALGARGLVPARPNADLVDLTYRFYRDTWDKLPDFMGLKFEAEGPAADGYFSLAPASRPEAIGLVFEGKLKVPQAGEYTFNLDSTDGVRLLIDGKPVLDRPGRGRQTQEVAVTLAQGLRPVRLEYFHTTGKPQLEVSWSGPGFPRRSLTPPPARGQVDLTALIRKHGTEVLGQKEVTQYFESVAELEAVRKEKVPEPGTDVMCVEERGRAETHVLIRGNPGSPGERVEAGVPEILALDAPKFPAREGPTSGRRRALAEWLTSGATPLPARVLANRLWQYHFGRGIVPTSNDFGRLGELPTHPELLDWLADDLVQGGWKLKRMHKLLLLSNTYQMSTQVNAAGLRADPANMLFWHFHPRRLAAEEVRDSILAVSGRLNLKAGGPSVYPPIPKEVLAGQSVPGSGWGQSSVEEASRRSVYVHVKRSLLVPILSQHDQADTDSSCAVRYTTTVPTQALGMLNGAFTNEQASVLADRLRREAPDDVAGQVRRASRLTTGRQPTREEVDKDVAFIKQQEIKDKLTPRDALRRYCLLVLNTNEFIYVD